MDLIHEKHFDKIQVLSSDFFLHNKYIQIESLSQWNTMYKNECFFYFITSFNKMSMFLPSIDILFTILL